MGISLESSLPFHKFLMDYGESINASIPTKGA